MAYSLSGHCAILHCPRQSFIAIYRFVMPLDGIIGIELFVKSYVYLTGYTNTHFVCGCCGIWAFSAELLSGDCLARRDKVRYELGSSGLSI